LTALGVNWWNRFFFNAIERKDVGSVLSGVGAIVGLAAAAAAAAVCLVHMRMRLQLRWRQWMTSYLIRRWLAERRFYQLNIVGGEGSHPEYRIAEDVRLATEPLVDFVIGLTNALLAAVAFISILWIVGGSLTISAFGAPLTIPGFMVIAAIVYSSLTSLAMFFVGRPLIAAVESKNAGEAQLRYELTSVRDSAENIALIGGDDDARAQLQDTFGEARPPLGAGHREAGAHDLDQQRQRGAVAGGSARDRGPQIPRRGSQPRRADADRDRVRAGADRSQLARRQRHPARRMAGLGAARGGAERRARQPRNHHRPLRVRQHGRARPQPR
jgi:hypothetical protein